MDKCGCETLYEDTTNAELLKQGIDEYFRKGEPEDGIFATLLKENRMRYENETVYVCGQLVFSNPAPGRNSWWSEICDRSCRSMNHKQVRVRLKKFILTFSLARAIARIFHALPSPRYSYAEWYVSPRSSQMTFLSFL